MTVTSSGVTSGPRRAPRRLLAALAVTTGLLVGAGVAAPGHADQVRDRQWHLEFLGIDRAHQLSQGEGVTVAVIDTGVNASHPDLKGNVLPGRDGFNRKTKGWTDYHDHGTSMATLVAGHGHGSGAGILGIAPKAKVLPITVVGPNQRGAGRTAVAQGIRYAVDHDADIVLVALAGPEGDGEAEAVAYAKSHDVLVIAGAGNASSSGGAPVGYPAAHKGVLAVSAVDRQGRFWNRSASGNKIGLAAPGVDIMTATASGGYDRRSGTSDAGAIVAGLAALVKAKFPYEDEVDLALRLGGTAKDKGPTGRDSRYGFGIPDVTRALTLRAPPAGGSASPSAPPTPTSPRAEVGLPEAGGTGIGPGTALVLVLVVLVLLGGVALLAVRWRRSRPAGPDTLPPAAVNPPAPFQPPPTNQAPPDDVWRRPDSTA